MALDLHGRFEPMSSNLRREALISVSGHKLFFGLGQSAMYAAFVVYCHTFDHAVALRDERRRKATLTSIVFAAPVAELLAVASVATSYPSRVARI